MPCRYTCSLHMRPARECDPRWIARNASALKYSVCPCIPSCLYRRSSSFAQGSSRMRHYCTYFDQNFLPFGLALHESLKRHESDFVLHTLCLDEPTFQFLSNLKLN